MFPRSQRTTESLVGPSPLPGPLAFPSPRFLRPPLDPCPHRPRRRASSIRRPCSPSCLNRQHGCRHCPPVFIFIILLTTVDGPVFMARSIHCPSHHSRRCGRSFSKICKTELPVPYLVNSCKTPQSGISFRHL